VRCFRHSAFDNRHSALLIPRPASPSPRAPSSAPPKTSNKTLAEIRNPKLMALPQGGQTPGTPRLRSRTETQPALNHEIHQPHERNTEGTGLETNGTFLSKPKAGLLFRVFRVFRGLLDRLPRNPGSRESGRVSLRRRPTVSLSASDGERDQRVRCPRLEAQNS